MTAIEETPDWRSSEVAPYGALFVSAVTMGASPILVRLAEVGPLTSAFWRILAALPALWIWQALERRGNGGSSVGFNGAIVGAGLFFALDLTFWHLAIANTTVANASFLATTSPVWVALGALFLFREQVGAATMIGLAMTIVGGAMLTADSFEVAPDRLAGDASAVLAAVFFGGYVLTVSHARRTATGARLLYLAALVSIAPLLVSALAFEDRFLPLSWSGVAALVMLGLVVHAGGQGLLAYSLGRLPATFSSLAIFLSAIAAALFGWVLFDESLSLVQVAGGIIILLGIYAARPRATSSEAGS